MGLEKLGKFVRAAALGGAMMLNPETGSAQTQQTQTIEQLKRGHEGIETIINSDAEEIMTKQGINFSGKKVEFPLLEKGFILDPGVVKVTWQKDGENNLKIIIERADGTKFEIPIRGGQMDLANEKKL